uniref:Uncharacterized protein n=1 Tax=Chenopodium quinoa TaxID=63459 RepID=A0A803MX72_CHEQI
MRVECTVADMHADITQLSDSVEGLKGKVEAAHTATQDLRDETLGLVNSALATIREEVAKLKEELLGQLRDIRAEVESVKEDVILCKKAAVTGSVTIQQGPKMEGSHLARNCPVRQKLSAMIATEEESAPTTRMGAMVMNEDAQLANMRLLNTSRVEDDDLKGRASPTSSTTNIKQGGSLMIVNGEVNEVPTRLLVDTGASHNFLAKEEAKALGVKFTKVDGEMKAINSEATPVYGRAWGVPVRLGKWKGKVDFLVVDIDDEDVVLGMEFLHKVLPFRVSDGMITITSKGSEIGIKLAQLKERDVRVSTLEAWWAPRQRHQGAIHGRIKATKMLGTRHHGVPRDGTTRLKCGVNRRDGAAAHRSTQGTSGALDRECTQPAAWWVLGCRLTCAHERGSFLFDDKEDWRGTSITCGMPIRKYHSRLFVMPLVFETHKRPLGYSGCLAEFDQIAACIRSWKVSPHLRPVALSCFGIRTAQNGLKYTQPVYTQPDSLIAFGYPTTKCRMHPTQQRIVAAHKSRLLPLGCLLGMPHHY